jgi:hypothetical protein
MLRRRDLADFPDSHPDFQRTQTEAIPHPFPNPPFSQDQLEYAGSQNRSGCQWQSAQTLVTGVARSADLLNEPIEADELRNLPETGERNAGYALQHNFIVRTDGRTGIMNLQLLPV